MMFVNSPTLHSFRCRPSRLLCGRPRTQVHISRGSGGSSGGGGGNGDGRGGDGERWRPRLNWLCAVCGARVLSKAAPAISAEVTEADEEVENIMEWLGPLIASIGISGIMGFASAAAFKFMGRAFAIAIGILFAALQCMVYFEVININWKRVEQKLDITGDGKFDQDDIEVGTRAFLRILTQGIPGIGGFGTGFILGLRMT